MGVRGNRQQPSTLATKIFKCNFKRIQFRIETKSIKHLRRILRQTDNKISGKYSKTIETEKKTKEGTYLPCAADKTSSLIRRANVIMAAILPRLNL